MPVLHYALCRQNRSIFCKPKVITLDRVLPTGRADIYNFYSIGEERNQVFRHRTFFSFFFSSVKNSKIKNDDISNLKNLTGHWLMFIFVNEIKKVIY